MPKRAGNLAKMRGSSRLSFQIKDIPKPPLCYQLHVLHPRDAAKWVGLSASTRSSNCDRAVSSIYVDESCGLLGLGLVTKQGNPPDVCGLKMRGKVWVKAYLGNDEKNRYHLVSYQRWLPCGLLLTEAEKIKAWLDDYPKLPRFVLFVLQKGLYDMF